MSPTVSVIIVCMNRLDNLYPCLESIRRYTSVSYEVILTAYMFERTNLERLRENFPEVKVVESNELRGFSENNNLALKHARGKYCFVVNDDTYFVEPVIDALVEDFERATGECEQSVAVVSPNILFPDGRVQTCGRRKLGMGTYMLHCLHLLDETKRSKYTMQEGLFRTYNLNGAAFLIDRAIFEEVGFFDETYTFTPEDIALSTKLNEMGYAVYADADVKLYHVASATASLIEAAIKPTRVRGALIFYSKGSLLTYCFLGIYVWCLEGLKLLKHSLRDRSDPASHSAIMFATAKNVMRNIFTRKSTKEVFIECYNQIKGL